MKYNSEVKYTSNKRNKGGGFLYSYARLSVWFSGLPESTFPCLPLSRVSSWHAYTHTHTHTHRSLWSRKNYLFAESSAAVDTLKHFHSSFGHYKPHYKALHFTTRAAPSPSWPAWLPTLVLVTGPSSQIICSCTGGWVYPRAGQDGCGVFTSTGIRSLYRPAHS